MLEIGAIVEGKVTGLTAFGAFVSLPDGKSGMVHISEVAQTYVNNISDHVKQGDVVKMKVLDIFDYLLKSAGDGKAAAVGIFAVKDVKIGYLVFYSVFQVSVTHSQLIKVAKHRKISFNVLHFCLRFLKFLKSFQITIVILQIKMYINIGDV